MRQARDQGSEPGADEEARLRALHRLLLNEELDPEYDAVVRLAATICEAPISLLTLVDRDRIRFKAKVGLPRILEAERADSFCASAIEQEGLMLVEDSHL